MKPPVTTRQYAPNSAKPGLTRPLTSEERRRAQRVLLSRSSENCRQDPDHRRRDSYRERHRRADRSVRSASTGHQAHHRKHHDPESRRSTGAASRTVQLRGVPSADRIYGARAKFLERLFSTSHQLTRLYNSRSCGGRSSDRCIFQSRLRINVVD